MFLAVGRVGSSTDFIVQIVEYDLETDKRRHLMDLLHAQRENGFHSRHALTLVFVENKRELILFNIGFALMASPPLQFMVIELIGLFNFRKLFILEPSQ